MLVTKNELIYENMDKLINKRKIYTQVYFSLNSIFIFPLFFINKFSLYEYLTVIILYIVLNISIRYAIIPSFINKVERFFDEDITYALNNDIPFEFRNKWVKVYIKEKELETIKEEDI